MHVEQEKTIQIKKEDATPRLPGPNFVHSSSTNTLIVGSVYPDVTAEQRKLQLLENSMLERKHALIEQEEIDKALVKQTHLEMARLWRKLTNDVSVLKKNMKTISTNQINWDEQLRVLITQSNTTARDARHDVKIALNVIQEWSFENEKLRQQNDYYKQNEDEFNGRGRTHSDSFTDDYIEMLSSPQPTQKQRSSSSASSLGSNGLSAKVRRNNNHSRGSRKKKKKKRNLGFDDGGQNPDRWNVEFSDTDMQMNEMAVTLPNVVSLRPSDEQKVSNDDERETFNFC